MCFSENKVRVNKQINSNKDCLFSCDLKSRGCQRIIRSFINSEESDRQDAFLLLCFKGRTDSETGLKQTLKPQMTFCY